MRCRHERRTKTDSANLARMFKWLERLFMLEGSGNLQAEL